MKRKAYERNRRLAGQTQQPIYKKRISKMSIEITKEKFDEYEKIRKEGRYNMFDPQARGLSSLSKAEWVQIITDYDKLNNAWNKQPPVITGDKDGDSLLEDERINNEKD